jgi:RNA polymerase sigma factor (sigma-70 family)
VGGNGSRAATAGEEAARLYRSHGAALERFCRGRLRSGPEAEDAVQATFLRVYAALRKGTEPRHEAAWLYRIAHNVCLSRIESSMRRARVEAPYDSTVLEQSVAAPPGGDTEPSGLVEALATLPPNLRRAILLREWRGLSYAEIADELEVSVSAVESLVFRARRSLRKALAGVLDLSWLTGWSRSLLAGSGAGAKAVAGVALLAVGAGGAGLAVAVDSPQAAATPETTTVAGRARPGPTPVAAGRATRRPAARTVRPAARPSVRAPRRAAVTHRPSAAPVAPRRAAPARIRSAPAAPAPSPSTPSTSPPPTSAAPTTAPASPPSRPASTRPAVTISVPVLTVPGVTVPVPTVTVPVATAPVTVSAPAVTITVPAPVPVTITTPTVTLP